MISKCKLRGQRKQGPVEVAVNTEQLDALAMQWSFVVRNSHRWAKSPTEVKKHAQRALDDLQGLGVAPDVLTELAACDVVEVQVDYPTEGNAEEASWPARIFPWEFVLSCALRALRHRHADFLVVRHLNRGRRPDEARDDRSSLLFVASAPGKFANGFDFDDERELVTYSFPKTADESSWLDNPTLWDLATTPLKSGALHISAIDSVQGAELLARGTQPKQAATGSTTSMDGIYLADKNGQAELVDANTLARSIAEHHTPRLVTFNAYRSAARLASMTVAHGAHASIGLQDRFDEAHTEQFYAVFYREWTANKPLLHCFREAFRAMRDLKALRLGSGIVLWCAESLLTQESGAVRTEAKMGPSTRGAADGDLKVRLELPASLNYSKLHNGEDLFTYLRIYNHGARRIPDVRVEVLLQAGNESYAFHQRFEIKHPLTALEHKARVALSWQLVKGLDESVQTTIRVRLLEGDRLFFEETRPVSLLPANEWIDDDESGPWLPSFVLPRDPAVIDIVDRARRYLRVLADDASVGFDGYQQVDARTDGVDDDQAWVVDVQVRAIWYTLLHDFQIGYINPPPTFTEQSQRLRRPSQIVAGRHGTCIDLALLLAACLEYIGINPVIFLIDGHAFPGYWRVEQTVREVDPSYAQELGRAMVEEMSARNKPWSTGPQFWGELQRRIVQGQIVPLETVDLTAMQSFDVAVAHGRENLAAEQEFHTMLDVVEARQNNVTPLPL